MCFTYEILHKGFLTYPLKLLSNLWKKRTSQKMPKRRTLKKQKKQPTSKTTDDPWQMRFSCKHAVKLRLIGDWKCEFLSTWIWNSDLNTVVFQLPKTQVSWDRIAWTNRKTIRKSWTVVTVTVFYITKFRKWSATPLVEEVLLISPGSKKGRDFWNCIKKNKLSTVCAFLPPQTCHKNWVQKTMDLQ